MAKYLDANGVSTLWEQVKAHVQEKIDSVVDSAPETLDTLKEVADWIAADETGTAALVSQVNNKTDKRVVGSNGTAEIFNEVDGGGAHFIHNDGSEAYVGVNDGGLDGMMAQIYADEKVNGAWVGSRINVYNDKIYYTNRAAVEAGTAKNAAACEIATKGDIDWIIDNIVPLTSAEIVALCE